MQLNDYAKYLDTLHEAALVEDDLRETVKAYDHSDVSLGAAALATRILFERFGVDVSATF